MDLLTFGLVVVSRMYIWLFMVQLKNGFKAKWTDLIFDFLVKTPEEPLRFNEELDESEK